MKECKFCGMPLKNNEKEICDVCKNDDFKEQISSVEEEDEEDGF